MMIADTKNSNPSFAKSDLVSQANRRKVANASRGGGAVHVTLPQNGTGRFVRLKHTMESYNGRQGGAIEGTIRRLEAGLCSTLTLT